ncbi:HNH endonuclease signature motif containing protein [Arthrobacter sp. PAMC25564]|uniref:HNH endonuclease signature motif containing protein n=1 Tax=Arthrobacter sp. PAMC25564 TaxID=2565366 RepID=UPI001F10FF39|nr:HNH endonuclease signature motif containing protein [Arthrobacter sp. PAMC25564]
MICPAPFRCPAPIRCGADPLRRLADGCLDGLAEVARLEARTAALKVRLAAEYVQAARALASPAASARERTAEEMALVAEVACVLTVSERAAGALLSECRALTTALPLTPARGCRAGDLVASRFRAKARTWRERHHPVSIEKRHTKSAGDRRVEYLPDRDGMAWLSAYLPADTAAGIWERSTAAARALQGPDEARSLAQLRADITASWLLTSHTTCAAGGMAGGGMAGCVAGRVPSPRAQVLITVPVLSLLGATAEPATLDGYGPIPPSMARRLVTDGAGSFYRVLTDPRDGAPLENGRTSYRLTKAQRQWLRLRDGRCPFPGCNNHSLDNEADHLLAWADGGTTAISNLGQPCPRHHRLKHGSAWTPTGASKDSPPGWTSPSRRHYPSEHQDWEPPHWPHHIQATDAGPDTCGDPERELPQDPFPDWHSFTAAHPFPAADTDNPGWPAPLDDPYPECFLLPCV